MLTFTRPPAARPLANPAGGAPDSSGSRGRVRVGKLARVTGRARLRARRMAGHFRRAGRPRARPASRVRKGFDAAG